MLGIVTSKKVLPNLEHTIAASMVGYPPTLLASQKLTKKLRADMATATAQGVDRDAVTLARTLIETGQIARMKAIMLEEAKGTDLRSTSMLDHLTALKVSQRTVLDSLQTPPGTAERKVGGSIRNELNLTAYQFPVEGVKDLTLLPLANEIANIYTGPDALPKYMLLKLQENWKKEDKNVIIHQYVSGSKTKWLDNPCQQKRSS